MLCSVQFGSVNSKAVELCCDETRFGEVGRGMAVIVWRGVVRRGRLWRSNYNNSH